MHSMKPMCRSNGPGLFIGHPLHYYILLAGLPATSHRGLGYRDEDVERKMDLGEYPTWTDQPTEARAEGTGNKANNHLEAALYWH
ncbi:hypothetical protein GX50_01249 [[Emmonsia] crescens]|uniref:Uncharacterized protein n=1 Tax=[Emmonsia] crescens TaxID=73230 RepID=A0A2B7ZHG3_9EURO|nr:hypothetical protein GX50_01249 [Emmonsia crescens]